MGCRSERSTYKILVGKPEGKRPLGTITRRMDDNIKMYLQDTSSEGEEWIDPVQDNGR